MRSTKRSRRARAIAVAVVLAAAGVPAALPGTAAADGSAPAEAVISAGARYIPRGETVVTAGPTGYLHQQEGTSGNLWTDYATGATTPSLSSVTGRLNTGLYATAPGNSRDVVVRDLATGGTTNITRPDGQEWSGAFNESSAVTYEKAASGAVTALHVLHAADGQVTDVPLPAEGLLQSAPRVVGVAAQDRQGAVITLSGGTGTPRLVLVDFAADTAAELFGSLAVKPSKVVLSGDKVLGQAPGKLIAYTVPRADPAAVPTQTAIPPLDGASTQPTVTLALAGDWILVTRTESQPQEERGEALTAVAIGGGAWRTLLKYAANNLATGPDGGVLVAGGGDSADWAVRRVTAAGAETPAVTSVSPVAPMTAPIDGLALGGGRLSVATGADSWIRVQYDYDLALTGTPEPGPRTLRSFLHTWYQPCRAGSACIELHALGNGRTAHLSSGFVESPINQNTGQVVSLPNPNNRIVDSSGRYTVTNDAGVARQYVGDFEQYSSDNITHSRPRSAASVWGTKLWKPAATKGSVNSYDLKTKKTSADIALGSGCVPQELQVVGRWLYWSCGPTAKAGVWDLTAKRNIPVPSGEALLGDGFLVRHDRTAGKLLLTDFHKGAGTAAATADFADLPAGDPSADRRITWTVDKFGGNVAYVDAAQRVHVKPVSVPRSPVTVLESRVDDYTNLGWPSESQNVWHGTWLLSRPPVSWSVSFRNRAGKVVRTIHGTGHEGAQVTTTWNGTDDHGTLQVGGFYTWTLSADPGDGTGSRTAATGTTQLAGAKSAWRDSDGDGIGELVALKSSGLLEFDAFGPGPQDGMAISSSKGWNPDYRFVPFGDLDGDRCADTLVRNTVGELYRYTGRCKGAIAKTSPRISLGKGFQAYNVLTSPGDLTGDGRADLIARKSSNGDVYLFAATSSGKLAAGKRIGASWDGDKKLVGAGDLNGDGFGDLLAQDKSNELWRYNGDGKGHFKARVKVANDWGASYNVVVGIGDITGDGKADLLARDTSNNLYRYAGTGKGTFGGRVMIWSIWDAYKGIF
ncbi:FG-GAP-like repeat-containing protein [Streptomyces sp. NPDC058691]|uniref:FG-GAP-like repeat-containing protein n=1 Tax=Streptomyces sp. NPDC058691 TaxID=3346601 RepID=UPI003651B8EF